MAKSLAIDLFCGLGGWTEGFLAEGYEVIGFDIEQRSYPAQLVLQDVLTIHGSQFRSAAAIVASPPCTEYSYMAMPWKRSKQIARALRGLDTFPDGYTGSRTVEQLNALFNACFRIQREASEAAGRHIPMVVENVKGAQPWVGPAAWHYGSFYLWGDVPALMPFAAGLKNGHIGGGPGQQNVGQNPDGRKIASSCAPRRWEDREVKRLRDAAGTKNGNDWFGSGENCSLQRRASSKSKARVDASAQIAKIPFPLAQHIARVYMPEARNA